MTGDRRAADVLVYGATGRLGRMVSAELGRRGVRFGVAGRDRAALDAIARRTGAASCRWSSGLEEPDLRRIVEGCHVLVNCAPSTVGELLLRAALDAGVHYTDAAGQQWFIQEAFERYGLTARERGVAVVPACGFDYAIGDCVSRLVAEGQGPLATVRIAYALSGPDVRRNSLTAATHADRRPELVYRSGRWVVAPLLRVSRLRFDFPDLGHRVVTRYGSGEPVTVPRHTEASDVSSFITVSALCPHPALEWAFPYVRPLAALAVRTPLRSLVGSFVGRFPGSRGPRDDVDAAVADPEVPFWIVAEGWRCRSGRRRIGPPDRRGIVWGRHSHALTATLLGASAERLAAGELARVGVLSPAMAFEPSQVLDELAVHGVRWRIEPAPDGSGSSDGPHAS